MDHNYVKLNSQTTIDIYDLKDKLNSVCRTCLSSIDLIPIFETIYADVVFYEILIKCTSLQIDKYEKKSPEHLCSVCFAEIIRIYEFLCKAKDVEKIILQAIAINKIKIEDEVLDENMSIEDSLNGGKFSIGEVQFDNQLKLDKEPLNSNVEQMDNNYGQLVSNDVQLDSIDENTNSNEEIQMIKNEFVDVNNLEFKDQYEINEMDEIGIDKNLSEALNDNLKNVLMSVKDNDTNESFEKLVIDPMDKISMNVINQFKTNPGKPNSGATKLTVKDKSIKTLAKQPLLNRYQAATNANQPMVDANQTETNVNQASENVNQTETNINQSLVNVNQTVTNANELTVNVNQPNINFNHSIVKLNQPIIKNNQQIVNMNQPILKINQPVANFIRSLTNTNQATTNAQQTIVNTNQTTENVKQPIVNANHQLIIFAVNKPSVNVAANQKQVKKQSNVTANQKQVKKRIKNKKDKPIQTEESSYDIDKDLDTCMDNEDIYINNKETDNEEAYFKDDEKSDDDLSSTPKRRKVLVKKIEMLLRCKFCNEKYQDFKSLFSHIRKLHQTELDHKCLYCPKAFKTKKELNQHMKVHPKEYSELRPFACDLCPARFKFKYTVAKHKIRSHEKPNENYACRVCGKRFHRLWLANRHTKTHFSQMKEKVVKRKRNTENKVVYLCEICLEMCESTEQLEEHKKQHEANEGTTVTEIENLPITEDAIEIDTTLEDVTIEHALFEDGTPKDATSKVATYKVATSKVATSEDATVKNVTAKDAIIKQATVTDTPAKDTIIKTETTDTITKDLFATHFQCETCGKYFKSKSQLRLHKNIHYIKIYPCVTCGLKFRTEPSLQAHKVKHETKPSHICKRCDKSFHNLFALKTHLSSHTDENPFKCHLCLKAFTQHDLLKLHLKVHTGDEKYMCEFCGKEFTTRENLKMHSRIHEGVRPYSCEICDKSFISSHGLRTHKNKHFKVAKITVKVNDVGSLLSGDSSKS